MLRSLFLACLAAVPLACTAQTPSPLAVTPAAAGAEPAATPPPAAPPAAVRISYNSCHVDGPYIAMTFDDGPHAANTPRLLDMLKERGIKATFFMCGENAIQFPNLIKRMVAEGHEVANHSWSHPDMSKMSDDNVKSQIERTQAAITAGGGVTPKIMRPPYGAFTERQKRWCFGELGLKVIIWDVDPEDWKYRNAAHVESEILKHTTAGSIVLSHDIHKTTIDAMPATLDALAAKGFKFVTVSQLIAMDHPAPPKVKATATPAAKAAGETAAHGSPVAAPAPGTAPEKHDR